MIIGYSTVKNNCFANYSFLSLNLSKKSQQRIKSCIQNGTWKYSSIPNNPPYKLFTTRTYNCLLQSISLDLSFVVFSHFHENDSSITNEYEECITFFLHPMTTSHTTHTLTMTMTHYTVLFKDIWIKIICFLYAWTLKQLLEIPSILTQQNWNFSNML